MNTKICKSTHILPILALFMGWSGIASSQVPVDSNGTPIDAIATEYEAAEESAVLSAPELEELVGPVALYPDDLLAIVLPASTYPLEIVQAARFLEELAIDDSLEPDEAWDESITALLNYPEVLQMLDEDIDWTWRLGEAVIAQQEALISAIESFRDRAYAAGNLKTDEYQNVSNDDGVIEIVPVDDEIIYVPYYEPEDVVVNQPHTVYYYYPREYPVYYYPYPAGHRFTNRYFWGVTTAFTIGWRNDYLHVYHPSYWGHPYYGHHYYGSYYRRPSLTVFNTWYVDNSYRHSRFRYRDGDYWRPRHRSGARQYEPRVRNTYYSSRSTDRSRVHARQDVVRSRNDQRLDLNLRDRNSTGTRSGTRTAEQRLNVTNRRNTESRGGSQRQAANRSGARQVRRNVDQTDAATTVNSDRRNNSRPAQNRRTSDRIDQVSTQDRAQIRVARDRRDRATSMTDRVSNRTRTPTSTASQRRAPQSATHTRPVAQNRVAVQRSERPPATKRRTSSSSDRRPSPSASQRESRKPAAGNSQRQANSDSRSERRKRR